jgi:iron only hydrogenase large subunit-like protein
MAGYNAKFAKEPRESHDAHRAIRRDEDLDLIFTWREQRKLTSNLTLHYERKLYLLPDTPQHRRYAGKYLDVYQYPDGKIEIRAAGTSLPYTTYDKLGTIDQGAIVENKRLGHALQISNVVQAQRDNRCVSVPSTAHRVNGKKVPRKKLAGTKTQRELNVQDLHKALQARG